MNGLKIGSPIKLSIWLLIGAIIVSFVSAAQSVTVKGKVVERGSGETLPYTHVFIKGTSVGTTSDNDGTFTLTYDKRAVKSDSLFVSYLGYNTYKVSLASIKDEILVTLAPDMFELGEFVIRPGENPAWAILRHAIANKKTNDIKNAKAYKCEEYSKIRFDLNHFTENIKKNLLLKPFDYIWANVDTTKEGVTFLPVLIVEKFIRHYNRVDPAGSTDELLATNTTGLAGPKLMAFVQDLYQAPDFYNDYVVILDKNFPGPLNENYTNNYKFHLSDSIESAHGKVYKIIFKPKQKHDLAFTGDMLIDSTTGGLKEINVRFDILANINFVRSFFIHQEYELLNGKDWVVSSSNVLGDFTVIENSSDLTGFFGRKNSTFKNYKIGAPTPNALLKQHTKEVESDSATNRSAAYWERARYSELTKPDEEVFKMSNRLEKDPAFLFRKNLVVAIATGYYHIKYIDVGNLFTFYSHNPVEGDRYKFGLKTSDKTVPYLSLGGYGAYGMKDEQWKYAASGELHLTRKKYPKLYIGANYKYDIEQLGQSFNALALDHVFSSLIQVGAADASRNYVTEGNIYIDRTLLPGLVLLAGHFNNIYSPTAGFKYQYRNGPYVASTDHYEADGLTATLKYSYQNQGLRGEFYDQDGWRKNFSKYPEVSVQYKYADNILTGSEQTFQKLRLSLKQQIRAKKLGYFQYFIEAGKTFGVVPHPFLDYPSGNQLILNDDYAFNLMKFMEYVSDEYVSVHLAHHFEGLGLDRIPYVNKLKWRSFVFAKAYFGNLSELNKTASYIIPNGVKIAKEPYYEVGFGFENIFKIARIDFVWRLTDRNTPDVYYFLVKPSFNLSL